MKKLLLLPAIIFCGILLNAQGKNFQFNGEQAVFTENLGQVVDDDGKPVPDVLAKGSISGLDIYITKTGLTYVMEQYEEDLTAKPHPVYADRKKCNIKYSRADIALTGATIGHQQLQFKDEVAWKSNYYKTADAKGLEAVSHYKTLVIQNVYPGIDCVWKFNTKGKPEYDFVVHPGANAGSIKMKYSYADIKPGKNQLIITTHTGSITEGPLSANSQNQPVEIHYQFNSALNEISFVPGTYDAGKDLVIDPPLSLNWSAQFGGSFSNGLSGVSTNKTGDIFLVGYTTSNNFPVTNPGGGAYIYNTIRGTSDAVLLKLDSVEHLLWSTYFGGPGDDFANSVCTDTILGRVYVTGGAGAGFPITTGPFFAGGQDAFISVFSTGLSLYSSQTYGGNATDEGLRIYNNFGGNGGYYTGRLYVTGYTNSTGNTFHCLGNFVRDSVVGDEAFVMALNNALQPYFVTTYGGDGEDYATSISTDSAGNAVVCGYTSSANIPLVIDTPGYYQNHNAGGYDGFILHFNDGNVLKGSTYYGGRGNDYFNDVATGINGHFVFTGRTISTNFPTLNIGGFGYFQSRLADSTSYDAFVVKTLNDLTLNWATYYGGTGLDAGTGIATDQIGEMYVTGFTFSNNFPTQAFLGGYNQFSNGGNSDGFLVRFSDLGVRDWSTYKGDSCFQYPNSINYCRKSQQFYVAGQGLLACDSGQGISIPDTGDIHNAVSSIGFCWSFTGQETPPGCSFGLNVAYLKQPCPGACNGIAAVTTTGGTPPFNIIWSSGSSAYIDSNLCAGDSWVEARDSLGCKAENSMQWYPLQANLIDVPITCFPYPGSVSVQAQNGNSPIQYEWSTQPGVFTNNSSIIVTDTGFYQVTAQDAYGCRLIGNTELGFNNVYAQGQLEVIQYPGCGPDSSGIVALDLQNMDSIFPMGNITWTDQSGNLLATGDTFYNATTLTNYIAVDSAFCYNGVTSPVYYNFNLDVTTDLIDAFGSPPSSCVSFDGSTTLQFQQQFDYATGNNSGNNYNLITVDNYPPVTYLWSDGETTASVTDLGDSVYTVTVTDNLCTTVEIFNEVLPNPQLTPTIDSFYCAGNSYGDISLYVSDGSGGPYNYIWFDGSTNPGVQGLNTGYYSVTVTDGRQCVDTATFYVPQGTPVAINAVAAPAQCYGGQGTVTISGSAGVPPYTNTGSFSEPPGNYNFTISDALGCQASTSVVVTSPPALVVNATIVSPVLCYGSDATVNVTASGGTPPYFNDGTVYLPSGTNLVQVTDGAGCVGNTTVTVPPGPYTQLVLGYSVTQPACNGDSATITITASGGAPPYTGTGVFHRSVGNWTFQVFDSVSCAAARVITVTPAQGIAISLDTVGITCSAGSITANASNGTGPYQYQWSTSPGFGDSSTIYVRDTGTYSVTVQDNNGCSSSAFRNVNYDNNLVFGQIEIVRYPSCGDSNGVFIFNSDNTQHVSWTWPGGQVSSGPELNYTYDNSQATTTYFATDTENCFNGMPDPVTYELSLTSSFGEFTISAVQPSGCSSVDSGSAYVLNGWNPVFNYVNPESGITVQTTITPDTVPQILYNWSTEPGNTTTQSRSGNSVGGNISVTVTDGNCQTVLSATLLHPPGPSVSAAINPNTCNAGVINLSNVTGGGGAPYIYSWSTGATSASISNLGSGSYTATITGANDCPVVDTFTIGQQLLLVSEVIDSARCFGDSATITLTASGGTSPYTGTGTFIAPPGEFIFTVTDNGGCYNHDSVGITQPSQLVVHDNIGTILCNGGNATISVTASGGTSPYTGTGSLMRPVGTSTITVSDANGCSATDTVRITQPSAIIVSDTVHPIPCNNDAEIIVTASGGTGPYTGTGDIFRPSGNYNLTVTDANGCTATATASVNQPPALSLRVNVTAVPCFGDSSTISIGALGGTQPYTGTGTFTRPAGNYIFDVTDSSGCAVADTLNITQPVALSVTDNITTPVSCYGGSASVLVSATGGTPPYIGTGTLSEPAGNDVITVLDAHGCQSSAHVTIIQPTLLEIGVALINGGHCSDSLQVVVSATGGIGPYTGVGNKTYTHNGTYTLIVTDANGCNADSTLAVHLDTCTGIEAMTENNSIIVYPNPTTDKFYIKFETPLNTEADARLFAIDGKTVLVKTLGTGENLFEVDCNYLASGSYILRTLLNNRDYYFKIVITR